MSRAAASWGVAVLVALGQAACGGDTEVGVSREPPEPGEDGGTAAADGGPRGDSGAGGGGDAGSGTVPPDLFERPTVWIGEVSGTVSYPSDAPCCADPEPERLMLILDPVTSGVITGTITFGTAPAGGADPIATYGITVDSGVDYQWTESPLTGFSYSIVSSELRGDRLVVHFAMSEIWTAWCADRDPNAPFQYLRCDCTETECHAAAQPVLSVDLVVSGSTMSGEYLTSSSRSPPEIRLQRVQ